MKKNLKDIAEKNAIEKSRYIDSQKAKRDLRYNKDGDPTDGYVIKWEKTHLEEFNTAWYTSKCRVCKNISKCNDCLKNSCDNYKFSFCNYLLNTFDVLCNIIKINWWKFFKERRI
jgi:hypothetical protein